jgi:hypothetical protein
LLISSTAIFPVNTNYTREESQKLKGLFIVGYHSRVPAIESGMCCKHSFEETNTRQIRTECRYQVEKVLLYRLYKNAQMQGVRGL